MGWSRRYAIVSHLRSSLWLVPLVALVLEQLAIRLVALADPMPSWFLSLATTPSGTAGAMSTIVSLTGSFIVFTFGSMLVAIQVASGQLTPRIIATALLRDNHIRFTVGLFVFTLLFAVGTQARLTEDVHELEITISGVLGIASIATFLYLIDYTARLLRPIAIVRRLADKGIEVIAGVYPDPVAAPRTARALPKGPGREIVHAGTSAIVLAVNLKALVTLARTADGVIEFVPRVGDFVASGAPLFRLHGGAASLDPRRLCAQVAFGPERTIEQDSTFAFRVIADVALKALSPAINDPTTAVIAIDQLQRLLHSVGMRHLHNETLVDAKGQLRVVFPTPNWHDFVQLSFSEIRLYGAVNFQVARRLRAMIYLLEARLPDSRRPELLAELALLDATLGRVHALPGDLALASRPDTQGLGGATPRDIAAGYMARPG